MSKLPILKLKPGKEVPLMAGHPWIFSNAIIEGPLNVDGKKFDEVGLVEVRAHDGYFLGIGMFNPRTSISVRILALSHGGKVEKNFVVDEKFFSERFLELERLKKEFLPAQTTAYRLVNADADWLPGLIVDRYGDVFVFQIHTACMDLFRNEIIGALQKSFDCEAIVERSDIESRKSDGLKSLPVKIHFGKIDGPVEFIENGVKFLADVLNGQKTGFFLDQREARRKVGELSKGPSKAGQAKKVLNLFSYSGGFGLYAALNGAEKVVTLDISERALELAQENFRINGIDIDSKKGRAKYEFICGDVFDYLANAPAKAGLFDLIICDPPAFAKSNDKIEQAKKAYIDLNKRCMELLESGGILISCSCSGRISHEDFRDILRIAAGRVKKDARILASLSQPLDHTERLCFTEGRYLKTFVLQVLN